jgi:hypothetical protein
MTTGRPFTRADYLAIKAATRRACEDVGPLNQVAGYTRVDAPILSRYGNPEESVFIPLDVAMDLDALSGGARILKAYAAAFGYELVHREEKGVAVECPMQHAASIADETGDVLVSLAGVMRKPSPNNAAKAQQEIIEARDVLDLAEADMRRIQARGS